MVYSRKTKSTKESYQVYSKLIGVRSLSHLSIKRYTGQTPGVGHDTLEGGARASSKIITTGVGLDTSVARDVPLLEGTWRIRASLEGVLGKTRARAPPLAEVLTILLGTRTEGGSAG